MKLKNIGRNPQLVALAPGPKAEKRSILIRPGESADVPDAVAEKLLDHYPEEFSEAPAPKMKAEKAAK